MADDLDDEWWLENTDAKGSDSGDQLSEDEDIKAVEKKPLGKLKKKSAGKSSEKALASGKAKRKHKDEESSTKVELPKAKKSRPSVNEGNDEKIDEPEQPQKKKRKRKTKTEELAAKPVVPLKPEDLIEALEKHYKGKLSTVEWDDIQLKAVQHFSECNDMKHNPVSYMRSLLPKWSKLLKKHSLTAMKDDDSICKGSPLVLVLSSAALRATQLNRELESFKSEKCKTAKLFAKHIKIQEQIKFLSKNVIHIGLGTPSRIQALLENGSLSLANTRKVVIDWSWRDVKLRRLVEIPEIKTQLFELLKKFIIPRLKEGNCRIGLM